MNVVFYQRDFSDKIKVKLEVKVDRYSWHMLGGPKQATLTIPLTADRWEFIKLLRCPVEIYGPDGRLNWWGFVNRVAVSQGIQRFGYSLDSMFNHVVVRYGQDLLTEAATNDISIAEYGQKELVLRSYNSTGLEASQKRAVELQDRKNPKAEIEFSGGSDVVQIECLGWNDTLEWKHYTNATESNVSNTTQISTIAASVGQFLNGVLIEDEAGVVSNQARDERDGLSCINELLQAGTSNNRPLLSRVDSNRYLHVFERSSQPPEGDVDYVMREDGSLETLAGGSLVPDAHCTVAKWVRAKGSPVEFSFFIESAEYNVENDKTTYRPAGGYEQRRLAKYISDVVTGDGPHVWPGLIPSRLADPQTFLPGWVPLGKDSDTITAIRGVVWDAATNYLYVCGQFTVIGGVEAVNFAKLNMATGQWYALETSGAPGSTQYGWAAVIADSKVYFGVQGTGIFWEYDDSTDTWTDLSSGTSGTVNCLAVDGTDVYLGGAFASMPGSANSVNISKYSGGFSALGTGIDYTPAGSGGVFDMVIDSGVLYAIGKFDDAGGTSVVNVAAWDGSWSAMGGGLGSVGDSLLCIGAQHGYIYGDNGAATNNLSVWDGLSWSLFSSFDGAVLGLGTSDDEQYLYIIGGFSTAGGVTAAKVAAWDGAAMYAMGGGITGGGEAWTMFDSIHPIAAGTLLTADGQVAIGLAMYITTLDGLLEHLTNTGGVARPGGPDKAIQYNIDGRFGGENEFRWDYTLNNLLIGSLTPPAPGTRTIHQIQEGASPAHALWAFSSSYASFLKFYKGNGTVASPTAILADEILGRIRAYGYNGAAWDAASQAVIQFVATGNFSNGDTPTKIEFYTTPDGSGTPAVHLGLDENGLDLLERSTDAATPGTGRWRIYPKSGGIYIVDDAGSVTGPLGTGGGAWDGDITDIDETSSSDIGAAIADDDQGIIYDTSATAWVRFAWSRVKTYIQALTDTLYETINTTIKYDGWIPAGTWTRTGDYTFTTTDILEKGWKVRYKDGGGYEYGTIIAVSLGSPNTYTLATNSDYAMAAATITDNYYSNIQSPDGWPQYFNYTPTPSASAGTWPATFETAKFETVGISVHVIVSGNGITSTTPNALRITLPIESAAGTAGLTYTPALTLYVADGGAAIAGKGLIVAGSPDFFNANKADGTPFGAGAGRAVVIDSWYEMT